MSDAKTGVFLVNLGTPDSPAVPDVRKYLRQFLLDPRVIDIPDLQRFLLVNCIIAPFRAPKSAKIYRELWTDKGSPLLYHGIELKNLVQKALGDTYKVAFGMRYQNPSLESGLNELLNQGLNKIIVLPLFPQYASASTGSVHEEVMRLVQKQQVIPEITFVSSFFNSPLFIDAFASLANNYLAKGNYDHILFSYHGLPERQIKKADHSGYCDFNDICCGTINERNFYCYRAQCFETTRLIVSKLILDQESHSTCFQSRLGKSPWIKPYADEIIIELPSKGKKRVLTLVPSFVADCLETTIEVGEEYKELFEVNGGEHWQMVESLNVDPKWVETIKQLVISKI